MVDLVTTKGPSEEPSGDRPPQTGDARVNHLLGELWHGDEATQLVTLRALEQLRLPRLSAPSSGPGSPIPGAVLAVLERHPLSPRVLAKALESFGTTIAATDPLTNRYLLWAEAQPEAIRRYTIALLPYDEAAPTQVRARVHAAILGTDKADRDAALCALFTGLLPRREQADDANTQYLPEGIPPEVTDQCMATLMTTRSASRKALSGLVAAIVRGIPWPAPNAREVGDRLVQHYCDVFAQAAVAQQTPPPSLPPSTTINVAALKAIASTNPAAYIQELFQRGTRVVCISDYHPERPHVTKALQGYIAELIATAGLSHVVIPEPLVGRAQACNSAPDPLAYLLALSATEQEAIFSARGGERLRAFCQIFSPYVGRLTFLSLPEVRPPFGDYTSDLAPRAVQGLAQILQGNPQARMLFVGGGRGVLTKVTDTQSSGARTFSLAFALQQRLATENNPVHHILLADPNEIDAQNDATTLGRMGADFIIPARALSGLTPCRHTGSTIEALWDSALFLQSEWPPDRDGPESGVDDPTPPATSATVSPHRGALPKR